MTPEELKYWLSRDFFVPWSIFAAFSDEDVIDKKKKYSPTYDSEMIPVAKGAMAEIPFPFLNIVFSGIIF